MKLQIPNPKSQNGTALILSVIVLSMVLSIALGLSTIMLKEVQFNRTAGFNIPAFFAADTGIEQLLTVRNDPVSGCTVAAPCILSNGAQYWVVVTRKDDSKPDGTTCASDNFCIESTGVYPASGDLPKTRRSIEANY